MIILLVCNTRSRFFTKRNDPWEHYSVQEGVAAEEGTASLQSTLSAPQV